jgi:hypothetical protein
MPNSNWSPNQQCDDAKQDAYRDAADSPHHKHAKVEKITKSSNEEQDDLCTQGSSNHKLYNSSCLWESYGNDGEVLRRFRDFQASVEDDFDTFDEKQSEQRKHVKYDDLRDRSRYPQRDRHGSYAELPTRRR